MKSMLKALACHVLAFAGGTAIGHFVETQNPIVTGVATSVLVLWFVHFESRK